MSKENRQRELAIASQHINETVTGNPVMQPSEILREQALDELLKTNWEQFAPCPRCERLRKKLDDLKLKVANVIDELSKMPLTEYGRGALYHNQQVYQWIIDAQEE